METGAFECVGGCNELLLGRVVATRSQVQNFSFFLFFSFPVLAYNRGLSNDDTRLSVDIK